MYRHSYNIFTCNGILFNHTSPRRGDNFVEKKICNYVAQYYLSGFSNKFPNLKLGNLDAHRDIGCAKEYVEAMYWMMQHRIPDDYVISTGKTYSIKDILSIAFDCIGIKSWENYVDVDKSLFRPSEVPYLKGNSLRARAVFGWEHRKPLDKIISQMVWDKIKGSV